MTDYSFNSNPCDTSSDSHNSNDKEVKKYHEEIIGKINIVVKKGQEFSSNLSKYLDNIEKKIQDIDSEDNLNTEIYKYINDINDINDMDAQCNNKEGMENFINYLKLIENINNINFISNKNEKKPEKQIIENKKLKKNKKPKKYLENSKKLIEKMKLMKLIKPNEESNSYSEYTCFSPLNDSDYMIFGDKKGDIKIYDFRENNEEIKEKYHPKSRINVFNDEIKYICELDEDLFAVSQRKNEIKIIKNDSIKQTINIEDYDDLYIYSMISLPNLSSKEKRHFLCVATDSNILIYKSNKTPTYIDTTENEDNEDNLYFEKYKDIKLETLTHCLIEVDNYLIGGCPNDKTINIFDMFNEFEKSAITDINMTSGSNIFALIPNKNLLVVACVDGFKLISVKKKKKLKSVHCTYSVLSLDMFNENTIICCCSENGQNIIKQYQIDEEKFEFKRVSKKRTNNNDEIWKLQRINDKIFFIDNNKRVMMLA